MARYTAAIVGCGSIGNAHMEGYNLVDDVEVIAVCDPVAPARKTYMDAYGIEQEFETVEETMAVVQPDIVSVCTWHLLHPAPTIAAAKGGAKAIICEKPMAIGMTAADSMVDGCNEHGTKLIISHQRRFTPGWEKAKALVAEGAIGTPIFVTNKVADGLTNWGTHSIDGSRFVLGDPQAQWVMGAVERRTDRYERGTMVEDACLGLVHFDHDLQLFIQSDLMREGAGAGRFEIRGSEGFLSVRETQVQIMNATSSGWQEVDLGLAEGDKAIGGNTNAAQVKELIAWLEGDVDQHRNAGTTARDTVEIMMALYESARKNHIVRLPLAEKGYPLELMVAEGGLPVEIEGRYDIRGFLKRDGIDEEQYKKLWNEGLGHHQIMRQLHGEMDQG
ncbi:MAG: Gfo/Idh/MocA family oxidoreductase [Candidatus Latescibacterota bacterium]|nr:Gfo/Idh/MocA family oxidoreductase [Candidatus Latescibacterota bacterium]